MQCAVGEQIAARVEQQVLSPPKRLSARALMLIRGLHGAILSVINLTGIRVPMR